MDYKKFVHYAEVQKEIAREKIYNDSLKEDIESSTKRIKYLTALANYLEEDAIIPFATKKLLNNDILLQEFVQPILNQKRKQRR